MKNRSLAPIATLAIVLSVQPALAGEVSGLTTFASGTPAKAGEVNGNFTAVQAAVNDNHGRVTALEAFAENPDIAGNITLVPSTAAAGNILKGSTPFLHDFGTWNTFLGTGAGNFSMTGVGNTATGTLALASNVDGIANTATGFSALVSNTSGINNTASGSSALLENTTGEANTAVGAGALSDNTTGRYNAAVGASALAAVTTGSNNIGIGWEAGKLLTTGNNNIAIGHIGASGDVATIRIGTLQNRTFIAGIRGITTGNANAINVMIDSAGQLGTVSSSRRFKDDIADMGAASDVLMKLRPVTFHYKSDRDPRGRTLQYGLIAEEVAQVAPNLVARSASGEIETVYYQNLAPMLLNEYQKQQRTIQAQAAALAKQTARVAALERQTQEIVALREQLTQVTEALARLQRPGTVASAAGSK